MMPKNEYRLKEYRIREFADGSLAWNGHSGFGKQTGGQCFISGNILVMGARRPEENGFLKSEFLDKLRNLRLWNRTRYYCFAADLLEVDSGRRISDDRFQQLTFLPRDARTKSRANIPDALETFRLRQYQITISPDGKIFWKSSGGVNRIVGGLASIESDVLFIGPQTHYDDHQSKKAFLHTLRSKPEWDRTTFWCPSLVLRDVFQDTDQKPPPQAVNFEKIPMRTVSFLRNRQSEYDKLIWLKTVCYCGEWVEKLMVGWAKFRKQIGIKNKSG